MPLFGCSSEIFVAEAVGSFRVIPTRTEFITNNTGFAEYSFTGIVEDILRPSESKAKLLHNFTIVELMDEVGRRIKDGTNKQERLAQL